MLAAFLFVCIFLNTIKIHKNRGLPVCSGNKPATIEGMDATFWIIGLVVLVILAIIIMLIVGKKRGESKTVSFDKAEEGEKKQLTQQEKSGNYQAQGGFNFAPATTDADKEPVLRDDQRIGTPKPKEAQAAPVVPPVIPGPVPDAALNPTPNPTMDPTTDPVQLPGEAAAQPQDDSEVVSEKVAAEDTDSFEAQELEAQEPAVPEAPAAPMASGVPVTPVSPTEPTTPVVPEAPAVPEPVEQTEDSSEEPSEVPETLSEDAAEALEDAPVVEDVPETDGPAPVEEAPLFAETVQEVNEPVAEAALEATAPAAESVVEPESNTADAADIVDAVDTPNSAEAVEAAEAAHVTAEFADAARAQTPVPDAVPEPAAEPLDEIAPAAGRIGKLRGRLSRSQNVFGKSVLGILTAGDLDEDAWEDIEAMLIKADLGSAVTERVVNEIRGKIAAHGVSSEAEARAMLRQTLIDACRPDLDRTIKAMPYEGKPAVVLVVGVNGTGKTTTTGKLARVLVSMGHKVLLGAADTFRAAAADQLETWGRRVGATTVRGAENADPASVAFDAVAKGVEQQADVVLIDTAGRLHTSTGLMDQLGKVKRVVEKKAVVDEVLLVLDATVGQNGMQQARIFSEVVEITGVVLTKLDGTAKGGIVFQVQEELGVPVKLVGLGEGADDLAPFEVEGFVDALLG